MHATMNVALLLLCVVGAAWAVSTDQFKTIVEPVLKKCKPEIEGATDADVENILHREELHTRPAKCLQYCVYEKLGGMRDGHVVSQEEALKVLHSLYDGDDEILEKASHKVEHCGTEAFHYIRKMVALFSRCAVK